MKADAEQLAILLAASGLSDRAIYESLREVESFGANAFVKRVQTARRSLLGRSHKDLFAEGAADELKAEAQFDQLSNQIIRQLQIEAQLTSTQVAERILSSLAEMKGELTVSGLPRLRKKEGLRTWLRRLTKYVPPSELLHHAAKIRNAVVHQPFDWPLRDRDK